MSRYIFILIITVLFIPFKLYSQEGPAELFEKSWITTDSAEKSLLRQKIVELYPDTEYGMFCKGWYQTEKQDYAGAIVFFSNAIKLNSDFWQAYYQRGNSYGVMKDFSNAISDISKALELNPGYGEGYFVRGATYIMGEGSKAKGCEDWQKAVSLGYLKAQEYTEKYCK